MLILFHLIGLLFVLIAPFFIYSAAKQNGLNGIRWALLSLVVGIGIQWVLPIIIRIVNSVLGGEKGFLPTGFATILLLFCLITSVVLVGGIWRYVGNYNSEQISMNL